MNKNGLWTILKKQLMIGQAKDGEKPDHQQKTLKVDTDDQHNSGAYSGLRQAYPKFASFRPRRPELS